MNELGRAIRDHRRKHEIALDTFSKMTGGAVSAKGELADILKVEDVRRGMRQWP